MTYLNHISLGEVLVIHWYKDTNKARVQTVSDSMLYTIDLIDTDY